MTIPRLTDEPGANALAARIAAGELSPIEAVDAAIARIEALDGPLNAVVVRDFDRARDAAKALDVHDIKFFDVGDYPLDLGRERRAQRADGLAAVVDVLDEQQPLAVAGTPGEHRDQFLGIARVGQCNHDVIGSDHPQISMRCFRGMNEKRGRTGAGKGGCDFLGDQA